VPFYDYICQKCGHELEVSHPVQGRGPASCPKCGGAMKKVISAPAVHFKGSGWARKERTGKAVRPADDSNSSKGSGSSASAEAPVSAPSSDAVAKSSD
jgi:putative FmdB family regulatory protein